MEENEDSSINKREKASCEQGDDAEAGKDIGGPRLGNNEDESNIRKEKSPEQTQMSETFDGKETEDFKIEDDNHEETERDEGIGSLMNEFPVSADQEKTTSLEDDTMGREDDADSRNEIDGTSRIEDGSSETGETTICSEEEDKLRGASEKPKVSDLELQVKGIEGIGDEDDTEDFDVNEEEDKETLSKMDEYGEIEDQNLQISDRQTLATMDESDLNDHGGTPRSDQEEVLHDNNENVKPSSAVFTQINEQGRRGVDRKPKVSDLESQVKGMEGIGDEDDTEDFDVNEEEDKETLSKMDEYGEIEDQNLQISDREILATMDESDLNDHEGTSRSDLEEVSHDNNENVKPSRAVSTQINEQDRRGVDRKPKVSDLESQVKGIEGIGDEDDTEDFDVNEEEERETLSKMDEYGEIEDENLQLSDRQTLATMDESDLNDHGGTPRSDQEEVLHDNNENVKPSSAVSTQINEQDRRGVDRKPKVSDLESQVKGMEGIGDEDDTEDFDVNEQEDKETLSKMDEYGEIEEQNLQISDRETLATMDESDLNDHEGTSRSDLEEVLHDNNENVKPSSAVFTQINEQDRRGVDRETELRKGICSVEEEIGEGTGNYSQTFDSETSTPRNENKFEHDVRTTVSQEDEELSENNGQSQAYNQDFTELVIEENGTLHEESEGEKDWENNQTRVLEKTERNQKSDASEENCSDIIVRSPKSGELDTGQQPVPQCSASHHSEINKTEDNVEPDEQWENNQTSVPEKTEWNQQSDALEENCSDFILQSPKSGEHDTGEKAVPHCSASDHFEINKTEDNVEPNEQWKNNQASVLEETERNQQSDASEENCSRCDIILQSPKSGELDTGPQPVHQCSALDNSEVDKTEDSVEPDEQWENNQTSVTEKTERKQKSDASEENCSDTILQSPKSGELDTGQQPVPQCSALDNSEVDKTEDNVEPDEHCNEPNVITEGGSQLESEMSVEVGDGSISGSFYADDDLSSIFSDDSQDMSSLVKDNCILREAMTQLRNDNHGVFTDAVSETSDEADDFYPKQYESGSEEKPTVSNWFADRGLNTERLNDLMREKRETQAKMRQLEREKAAADRRVRQDKMDRDFLEERFSLRTSHLEKEIQNLKQENQLLKRASTKGTETNPNEFDKKSGETKDTEDLFGGDKDGSIAGQDAFSIDIAMLAKENEKLSEIIDHLQESPGPDCLSEFVDNLDRYVPKDEYIKLENEKFKLETALREKERLTKEQVHLLEETKFHLEEEIEILKENLKKAETKNAEKGKLLSQYDIKMMEAKTKFTEKVGKLEFRLQQEISNKMKLESVIVNLKKCNQNFDKEIQGMKERMNQLQKQRAENEENRQRKDLEAEERLRQEAEEKMKLGRNVEALLQDLMQLKEKMLEEAENHRQEKEKLRSEFENEKSEMIKKQEDEQRRLKFELDAEKRSNEPMKKRMRDIPAETIVSNMGNRTEVGIFESHVTKNAQGTRENALVDEQDKGRENEDMVLTSNNIPDNGSWSSSIEDNTEDLTKVKRKLAELAQLNGIIQQRNKEIEQENINLKETMERVEKDVSRLRELEDKNEELQEEITRNEKRKNQMLRKQQEMMDEREEFSKELIKAERNNSDLSEEVKRLNTKIKTMEIDFKEERLNLTSSLEDEKKNTMNDTEKLLEEQRVRNTHLENEIEDLNADIKTLKKAKRTAEETFVSDMRNLTERHTAELENERERHRQLQDELNNNAGTVRRVTEQWEQMLRNTVNRYEQDLQRGEEERRKMADDFQCQREEMKTNFDKEREKLQQRNQMIEQKSRMSKFEEEFVQEAVELSFFSPENEAMEVKSRMSEKDIDMKHQKNEQIRTLDDQKQKPDLRLEHLMYSHDEEKRALNEEYKKDKQKLEETLSDHYRRVIADSKQYYEGLLQDQKRKHEKENEELENRFKKERKEYEEKLAQDFSNNLSSRSIELENKIEELVSQKVRKQKEITKRIEVQMRGKIKAIQSEKNENKKKFERENKVLEATIQALTKELANVKQETKDLKKKQRKERAAIEEAFENEKKEMTQMWERCKLDTINQIEDEWSEKMKNEQTRSDIIKEELQESYETKIKQLKMKCRAQKTELEGRLAHALSDVKCLAEAKNEMRSVLEDEYKRKLQKEKENIESTLQGLRYEIGRLQEHRKQLQNQMTQRESQAKINAAPLADNNAEVTFFNLTYAGDL